MPALSDTIESFIKELIDQTGEAQLKRNELAQYFSCAPSQINYVLSTRFSLDRGYVVASRRGGGGYIRVMRVACDRNNLIYEIACNSIGSALNKNEAFSMTERIMREGLISQREGGLIKAALEACALPIEAMQDGMRARVMRAMLEILIQASLS